MNEGLLITIIVGAIVGWLAGNIVDSDSSSILLDIVIGIVGSFVGVKVFGHMLYLTSNGFVNSIITALAGAVILALAIKLIRRATR